MLYLLFSERFSFKTLPKIIGIIKKVDIQYLCMSIRVSQIPRPAIGAPVDPPPKKNGPNV